MMGSVVCCGMEQCRDKGEMKQMSLLSIPLHEKVKQPHRRHDHLG
jgi:hypothetical protein